MDYFKTKEIAQLFGVSSTTIKRWVASCPERFRKDVSGHYVFSESELETLIEIQKHHDSTHKAPELSQILSKPIIPATLKTAKIPAAHLEATEIFAGSPLSDSPEPVSGPWLGKPSVDNSIDSSMVSISWEDVSKHLYDLEGRLSRKAGDVVSFQVLEHRREIDELRCTISELACTLDSLTEVFTELRNQLPSHTVESSPLKRKSWLGSFL
ncbi:MAG: helix-turn-helix domain-containing protein [Gorillibacterium sp.]|nr:helix-turn-helix domain-containing protein [Gorillibacterium sp.]